jgi:hypothetical protein
VGGKCDSWQQRNWPLPVCATQLVRTGQVGKAPPEVTSHRC